MDVSRLVKGGCLSLFLVTALLLWACAPAAAPTPVPTAAPTKAPAAVTPAASPAANNTVAVIPSPTATVTASPTTPPAPINTPTAAPIPTATTAPAPAPTATMVPAPIPTATTAPAPAPTATTAPAAKPTTGAAPTPAGPAGAAVPAPYTGVKDPFTVQDAAAVSAGQAIYAQSCLVCHGEKGDGKGPVGGSLTPPAADFTSADVKQKFTTAQDELFWRVSEGWPGTSMPSFKTALTEQQRWQVLTYEWTLGAGQ